ncbi:MAG: acyl carrier protein [Candidatus Omnitrophica bacterium]|nr:acyl carrier protein [Candidatus Omnitrophota bacterium]
MDRKKIEEMVDEVFEESFEIEKEQLSQEKGIFQDLGLDSLDIVDLIVALQKKFGVKIRDDNRVREIRTLGDIYSFIESLYKEGSFTIDKN